MAARGPKTTEARFSEKKKKTSFFFEIHRTSDTSMGSVVLYPSEIMHMDLTEPLLARAVFTRSNKVPGWQPGAPKIREQDFPKKKRLNFLEFIEPVTPL